MGCLQSTGSSTQDKVIEYLNNTTLFIHFDDEQLRKFASFFTIQSYAPFQKIVKQGDPINQLYVVGQGSVVLHLEEANGDTMSMDPLIPTNDEKKSNRGNRASILLTTKKEGSFINNLGIMEEDAVSPYTISAHSSCSCAVITKSDLHRYISTSPALTEALRSGLGHNLEDNLKQLPLFSSVSEANLKILAIILHFVPLQKDDVLFHEGDLDEDGSSMYIVYKGTLKAVAEDDTGNERLLNQFKKGQFFGEIGLMIDIPRTATVKALEKCMLLEMKKKDFQTFLQLAEDENLEQNIREILRKRIAESFRKYKVPLFSAIPVEKYAELARLAQIEVVPPNTIIFKQGEPGRKFYLIADGQCKVTCVKEIKGKEQELFLTSLHPGNYFGEHALLSDEKRNASVTTISRTTLVSINGDNFKSFFQNVPEALAQFEIRSNSYKVSLNTILHHPLGFEYFMQHLKREYATENLLFWQAVREYHHKFGAILIDKFDEEKLDTEERFMIEDNTENQGTNGGIGVSVTASSVLSNRSDDIHVAHHASASTSTSPVSPSFTLITVPSSPIGRQRSFKVDPEQAKAEMTIAAKQIIDEYVAEYAANQVNIPAKTRSAVLADWQAQQITPSMFAQAHREIATLMQNDNFARFKESELFQQFLDEQENTLRESMSSPREYTRTLSTAKHMKRANSYKNEA